MTRPSRLAEALPVLLYFLLASLYLFAIPPGESPDEPSHLQCIEQVTRYNRIPEVDPLPQGNVWWNRERIISGLTCLHMPLYYFLAGYTQQIVQTLTHLPAHYEFPPNSPKWITGESSAMFVPPLKNSFFEMHEPAALWVLRLESILLGLVSIGSARQIARRLMPAVPYAAPLAMTLVAGWPQFLFMSRAINNDALANALALGVLTVLVNSHKPNRFILASLLAALAILSKLTMVFSAAVVILFFLLEVVASHNRSAYKRAGLLSLITFCLLAGLILFQPTLRTHWATSDATIAGLSPLVSTPAYWQDVFQVTLLSGWAKFGWMNIATPDLAAYSWWLMLAITSGFGVGVVIRACAQNPEKRLALSVCGIWILAVLAIYIRINLNRFQPQFRYAFSIVPVLAALAAIGLMTRLNRFERLQPLVAPALGIGLALVNLWLIFGFLVPAYA